MKLKEVLSASDRSVLLRAQARMLDNFTDDKFDVNITADGKFEIMHPDMPRHVNFGPIDFNDLDDEIENPGGSHDGEAADPELYKQQLEQACSDIIKRESITPIKVVCRNTNMNTMLVTFKSLTDAFYYVLAYNGLSFTELLESDDDYVAQTACSHLEEDVRPA